MRVYLTAQPVGEGPVLDDVEEGRGGSRGDDPVSEGEALVAPGGPRQRLLVRSRVTQGTRPVNGQREQGQGVHRGPNLTQMVHYS